MHFSIQIVVEQQKLLQMCGAEVITHICKV